jgi:hypothetical protein
MKRFGVLIGQAIEACLEVDGRAASSRFEDLVAGRAIKASREADGQVQHTPQSLRVAVAGCPE